VVAAKEKGLEAIMGLIEFVRDAGQKIFGADKATAAPADPAVQSKRASALEEHVRALGLQVENLKIKMADTTAHVRGKVADQATREKVVLAIGNTAGVSGVDDGLEVVAKAPEARYYTVRSGDTLSKIAKAQYGDANKYPTIFEANRPMLKDPDKIYPGQVLRIPPL
jgi:nucleoid-associated protein YgaU